MDLVAVAERNLLGVSEHRTDGDDDQQDQAEQPVRQTVVGADAPHLPTSSQLPGCRDGTRLSNSTRSRSAFQNAVVGPRLPGRSDTRLAGSERRCPRTRAWPSA